MQSFVLACVAAIVIAVAGYFVLGMYQEPAEMAYTSSTGVRLGSS
jgi:hypothetical protein